MRNTYKFLGVIFLILTIVLYKLYININSLTINDLLYELVIGILLSIIFSFLVDYLPQMRNLWRGYRLIQYDYSRLLNNINIILLAIKNHFDIDKPLEKVTEKDWYKMFNVFDTNTNKNVFTVRYDKNSSSRIKNTYSTPGGMEHIETLHETVITKLKRIYEDLDKIEQYSSYLSEDKTLIESIIKLRNSSLFDYIDNNDRTFNDYSDTYQKINDLQNIFFDLESLNIHYYSIEEFEFKPREEAKRIVLELQSGLRWQRTMEWYRKRDELYKNTIRSTYFFKKDEYAKKLSLDLKNDRMDFIEYPLDNIKDLDEYVNNDNETILILNLSSFIKNWYWLKKIDYNNLNIIIYLKFLGLLISKTKRISHNKNTNLWLIPVAFKTFNYSINHQEPTLKNISILTSTIVNEFRKQIKN